ncbi:hypothetical protein [Ferrovibrio sp.]|uniref:hypothetical protein n=1 Tax=Ferrovibrio sp. TaxID=1917215 RepID=UPI0035AE3A8A
MISFANLIGTSWGKALLAGALVVALAFAVHRYNDSIRRAAYDAIFRTQVEEILAEREKTQAELLRLLGEREKTLNELAKATAALTKKSAQLEARIKAGITSGQLVDRPVGPVLRETLRGLE